jgi:hypothetical protein
MERRNIILAIIFGSTIGGYIPTFFGAGIFSLPSILGGAAGAILGVWLLVRYIGN